MPQLYLDDPRDDLTDLERLAALVDDSSDQDWMRTFRKKIEKLRGVAECWLADHHSPGDFARWG